jgi:hypothetical protein
VVNTCGRRNRCDPRCGPQGSPQPPSLHGSERGPGEKSLWSLLRPLSWAERRRRRHSGAKLCPFAHQPAKPACASPDRRGDLLQDQLRLPEASPSGIHGLRRGSMGRHPLPSVYGENRWKNLTHRKTPATCAVSALPAAKWSKRSTAGFFASVAAGAGMSSRSFTPILAVCAMFASSLMVVGNTLRVSRLGRKAPAGLTYSPLS